MAKYCLWIFLHHHHMSVYLCQCSQTLLHVCFDHAILFPAERRGQHGPSLNAIKEMPNEDDWAQGARLMQAALRSWIDQLDAVVVVKPGQWSVIPAECRSIRETRYICRRLTLLSTGCQKAGNTLQPISFDRSGLNTLSSDVGLYIYHDERMHGMWEFQC